MKVKMFDSKGSKIMKTKVIIAVYFALKKY